VLGSDFCHPMLVAAHQKVEKQRASAVLFESDALNLPLRDASLDLLTVAFGFRNQSAKIYVASDNIFRHPAGKFIRFSRSLYFGSSRRASN